MKAVYKKITLVLAVMVSMQSCGPFSSQAFLDTAVDQPTIEESTLPVDIDLIPEPVTENRPEKKEELKTDTKQPEPAPVTAEPTAETTETSLPVTETSKPTATTSAAVTAYEPLAWELDPKTRSKHSQWSKMIYQIIQTKAPEMLGQNVADDVEIFCPKYRTLKDAQRLNFWGQLIVGIAKFESSWNPTSSSTEYLMSGTDSVTKKRIVSEGLLQISYQDEKNYRIDCGFDWEKDKKLSKHDPKKTILDPYLNLNCGIQIFAQQLKRIRRIVAKEHRGLYWAVLYNGRSNKIKDVAKITNTLTFCK